MHRSMKQLPDRAISEKEAREILRVGEYCVVATVDEDGNPYATPLSYLLDGDTPLIHTGAAGGQKTEDWSREPCVCVTVVLDMEPGYFTLEGEEGFFTTRYANVIATGTIRLVEDPAQVRRALAALCLKYSPEFKDEIGGAIERELPVTAVWAIDLNHISGKAGRRLPNGKGAVKHLLGGVGMQLETDRLILRPWLDEDAAALYELARDARVGSAAGCPPHESVEQSLDILQHVLRGPEQYAITLKCPDEGSRSAGASLIGAIGLRRKRIATIWNLLTNTLRATGSALPIGATVMPPRHSRGSSSTRAAILERMLSSPIISSTISSPTASWRSAGSSPCARSLSTSYIPLATARCSS